MSNNKHISDLIMKIKYCPNCGSLELKQAGLQIQCNRCKFVGEPKEDSMDVINSFRKRMQGKTLSQCNCQPEGNASETSAEQKSYGLGEKKEELKKKFSSSNDVEFV